MKLMLNGKEVSGMGHYVMAGDIKDATAEDSNVLSGKTYYNNNGKREGTMPNRGGMSAELAAGGSTTIPEGYHNGEGVVRAQDLASQTPGTAAAANIEAGYTAWVNGEMVEGSLVPVEVVYTTFSPTTSTLNSTPWQFPEALKGKDNILLFTKHTSSSGAEMCFFKRGEKPVTEGWVAADSGMVWDHDNATLAGTVTLTFNKDRKTLYIYGW